VHRGAWVKLRVNRQQDFIVGGYVPRGQNFDSILVGYCDGHDLKYAASIRAGFTPASRQALFKGFSKLEAAEVSILKSARRIEGPVGNRNHGRQDSHVPLAQAADRRRDRFPGVDARRSAAPSFVRRAYHGNCGQDRRSLRMRLRAHVAITVGRPSSAIWPSECVLVALRQLLVIASVSKNTRNVMN
jgi:hypothetical protein